MIRSRPPAFRCPTSESGTGATNVIPGELTVLFNFRFSTEQTAEGLMTQVERLLEQQDFDYSLDWENCPASHSRPPRPALIDCSPPEHARGAAFRAGGSPPAAARPTDASSPALGTEIVELGPVNATIHSVDEHVRIEDLIALTDIYRASSRRGCSRCDA